MLKLQEYTKLPSDYSPVVVFDTKFTMSVFTILLSSCRFLFLSSKIKTKISLSIVLAFHTYSRELVPQVAKAI